MPRDDSAVPNPPWPRGVADPAAGVGYVSEPAGTVAAVNLPDGSLKWRAQAPGTPLAAGEGRVFLVVAEAPGVLHIQVLDAASGEIVAQDGMELEGAVPRLSLTDLDLSAFVTPAGLELEWRHRGAYRGGAPPSREVEERFSRRQAGAVRYSPESGVVERLPARRPSSPPASFPYRQHGRWREEAWLTAGALVRLHPAGGQGRELWLEHWPPEVTADGVGEPLRRELVWRSEEVEPSVTGDGSHLFLRRTQPPGRLWHVLTVPGGEPTGEVRWQEGDQWPEVLEGHVYHLATTPQGGVLLRAVELASGRSIWQRELAQPADPRPVPPPPPG